MTSDSNAFRGTRILAAVVALCFTAYALFNLLSQLRQGFYLLITVFAITAATGAIICVWFSLRGHVAESRARIRFTIVGGVILGGIGFVAGFFGPLILAPTANQGPLLGILYTGPMGFVLGTAIAWLYQCLVRRVVE